MNVVIVRDNIVENVGAASPHDGPPPAGTTAHPYAGRVSKGWLWNDGAPVEPPTPAAEVDYKTQRAMAYPPLVDLADALVEERTGNPKPMAAYVAVCLAIKAKFTKAE